MNKEFGTNIAHLIGEIVELPAYDHSCGDIEFYKFYISVDRLSDVQDKIPIIVSENILKNLGFELNLGEYVRIDGEFRSYRTTKVELFLYAKTIKNPEDEDWIITNNYIKLKGVICKNRGYRETPKGRKIIDLLLKVHREYNKASYIPCIVWNLEKEETEKFKEGDQICIVGRIQSREYNKNYDDGTSEIKVVYEVSVARFCNC